MLGLCLALVACKQDEKKTIESKVEVAETAVNQSERVQKLTSELLRPMAIVKEDSAVVTEKYGLDFSGNCYACDVANMLVDGEMITLMNACDLESQISLKITSIEETDKAIIVVTPSNRFVFTEVEETTLYKLDVIGTPLDQELFRTAEFYTLNSLLNSFEIHDCGEFEG